MPTGSAIANAMTSAVERDREVLARARWPPGPSCAGTRSCERDRAKRAAARQCAAMRSTSGPSGAVLVEHGDARAHGGVGARARLRRASRDRQRRADRPPAPRPAARSRRGSAGARRISASFSTQCERHRRMVLDAFETGRKSSERRLARMADLGRQRRQRLLEGREAGMRGSAPRELQRQVGERGRHEAQAALDARGSPACASAMAERVERKRQRGHVEVAVRQHRAVGDEHERAVRRAVELELDCVARVRERRQRSAPCTCATTRNDSGSCTRRAAPGCQQRAAGEQRAQPRRDVDLAGRRRAACARGSSGDRLARKPSNDERDAASHASSSASASCSTSAARPTVAALALMSASPSLAPSVTGARPARRKRLGAAS